MIQIQPCNAVFEVVVVRRICVFWKCLVQLDNVKCQICHGLFFLIFCRTSFFFNLVLGFSSWVF